MSKTLAQTSSPLSEAFWVAERLKEDIQGRAELRLPEGDDRAYVVATIDDVDKEVRIPVLADFEATMKAVTTAIYEAAPQGKEFRAHYEVIGRKGMGFSGGSILEMNDPLDLSAAIESSLQALFKQCEEESIRLEV